MRYAVVENSGYFYQLVFFFNVHLYLGTGASIENAAAVAGI